MPSPCPVLDFGHEGPVGDPNDPWRRMPALFQLCVDLFGGAMANRNSRTRKTVQNEITHVCRLSRTAHGPCTMARARVCHAAFQERIAAGKAFTGADRHAVVRSRLRKLTTDELHQERLKGTCVAAAPLSLDIRLPEMLRVA